MKKSELIKIIKEEVFKLLSEKYELSASVDLSNMTEEDMRQAGPKTLHALIKNQCRVDIGGFTTDACRLAEKVYLELNPRGTAGYNMGSLAIPNYTPEP